MAAPPKSILKKLKNRPRADYKDDHDEDDDAMTDAIQRRRDIAMHHAQIIQQRKDLEAQILDDIILLSEYPLAPTAKDPSTTFTAATPAPTDVADFKAHIRLFQPGDYDDLIEERNVNGLCGYTLCGRPRRETGPGGEWKITASGHIARRKDIEMWCSNACARRALYVKVQLNETAAWERAGIPDIEIDLLDEDKSTETEADRTARQLGEMQLEEQRQSASQSAALALERGDNPESSGQGRTFQVTLREKPTTTAPPEAGVFEDEEQDHLRVEGHKSKS
jgi:RNA polymerase II-associated protein 2